MSGFSRSSHSSRRGRRARISLRLYVASFTGACLRRSVPNATPCLPSRLPFVEPRAGDVIEGGAVRAFDYVMMLAAIVIGLALTHLMQGIGRIRRKSEARGFGGSTCSWVAHMVLISIFWWWFEFQLADGPGLDLAASRVRPWLRVPDLIRSARSVPKRPWRPCGFQAAFPGPPARVLHHAHRIWSFDFLDADQGNCPLPVAWDRISDIPGGAHIDLHRGHCEPSATCPGRRRDARARLSGPPRHALLRCGHVKPRVS